MQANKLSIEEIRTAIAELMEEYGDGLNLILEMSKEVLK